MALVSSFDGNTRRITLTALETVGVSWQPLDIYREHRDWRRLNEPSRVWSPLVKMVGGEPKGGGKFAPRFLQMLTDERGITTKLILPDVGPYRTTVDGELATDVPDTDAEPFDLSGLTTTGVVIDYKPVDAEIISTSGITAIVAATPAIKQAWTRSLGPSALQGLILLEVDGVFTPAPPGSTLDVTIRNSVGTIAAQVLSIAVNTQGYFQYSEVYTPTGGTNLVSFATIRLFGGSTIESVTPISFPAF